MIGFHFSRVRVEMVKVETKRFIEDDGGPYVFRRSDAPELMWVDAALTGDMTEVHDVNTGEIVGLHPSERDLEVSRGHHGHGGAWVDLGGEA